MILPNKNGDLFIMSISTSMLGQVPILSLKLKASLDLYNVSTASSFSSSCNHVLLRSIYFSNIFLSEMYFLSSVLSNHGYFSHVSNFSSFFCVFIKLLNCLHTFSADLNLQNLLRFCCSTPCCIL